MENHHDQNEHKPANKWIAPPILAAIIVIGLVVTFISFASGTGCGGKYEMRGSHGNVEHGETPAENEDKDFYNEDESDNESGELTDTTATNTDSTDKEGSERGEIHDH